ncbi:MAG: flagellin [Alkalimonas sp.]|nr:flagellin [Alkalimonas sp.]
MAQIINTNIASLNAQRNLNTSQSANATALERLSSGLRINSAKDDAAGLAISTRFESQTRGLNQAIRNAGDGISLAQTAEGALGTMTDNLQRIRELAVQSANATNSDEDRLALQQEVRALVAEITRTGEETNFNGRALFDGQFNGTFQIGANAGQTVDVQIAELTAAKLGASDQVGVSGIGSAEGLKNGDLIINGAAVGTSSGKDDNSSIVLSSASAVAKAAAINRVSDESGVTAFANATVANGTKMEADTSNSATTQTISLNGVSISLQSTDNTNDTELSSTRASVIQAINAVSEQTGVVATDGGNDNGVILTAADGRNISLSASVDDDFSAVDLSAYGLASAIDTGDITAATQDQLKEAFDDSGATQVNDGIGFGVFTAGVTLVAEGSTRSITIAGGEGTGSGDLSNSGLTRGTFDARTAYATNDSRTILGPAGAQDTDALEEGDLVINGVAIGASSGVDDRASNTVATSSSGAASGIAIAAAINRASDSTGVTATVNETRLVGATSETDTNISASAGASLAIVINNVDIGVVTSQGDRQTDVTNTIDLINSKSGQTGVVAEDNGEGITLVAADGRNISILLGTDAATAGAAGFGLDDVNVEGLEANANIDSADLKASDFADGAATTYSTVTLSSATAIEIAAGSKGNTGLNSVGFVTGTYGGGEDGQFLKDIDISTFEGAQEAITAIDNALSTVAGQRAELGALQNRFESTVANLAVTAENLTAANSRIRDADFAAETAELSRTQVLQQAGISILAQANQRPQQVLSLLG